MLSVPIVFTVKLRCNRNKWLNQNQKWKCCFSDKAIKWHLIYLIPRQSHCCLIKSPSLMSYSLEDKQEKKIFFAKHVLTVILTRSPSTPGNNVVHYPVQARVSDMPICDLLWHGKQPNVSNHWLTSHSDSGKKLVYQRDFIISTTSFNWPRLSVIKGD